MPVDGRGRRKRNVPDIPLRVEIDQQTRIGRRKVLNSFHAHLNNNKNLRAYPLSKRNQVANFVVRAVYEGLRFNYAGIL